MFRQRELYDDRITTEPITWICWNPMCIEDGRGVTGQGPRKRFEFVSDYPECPKCGASLPYVTKKALIHLLIADTKGQIIGEFGNRMRLACNKENDRWWLATDRNQEAVTNNREVANCPTCLKNTKGLRKNIGRSMNKDFMKRLEEDTEINRRFLESLGT